MSAVKRGEWGIASVILGHRDTGLGLPFLWDTEARDMVAQRPGKVCTVKLVKSKRHEAAKGGSIQPRSVLYSGRIGCFFLCQGKGPKQGTLEKLRGQCLTYCPQGAIIHSNTAAGAQGGARVQRHSWQLEQQ